jgi:hypothetical protein
MRPVQEPSCSQVSFIPPLAISLSFGKHSSKWPILQKMVFGSTTPLLLISGPLEEGDRSGSGQLQERNQPKSQGRPVISVE